MKLMLDLAFRHDDGDTIAIVDIDRDWVNRALRWLDRAAAMSSLKGFDAVSFDAPNADIVEPPFRWQSEHFQHAKSLPGEIEADWVKARNLGAYGHIGKLSNLFIRIYADEVGGYWDSYQIERQALADLLNHPDLP